MLIALFRGNFEQGFSKHSYMNKMNGYRVYLEQIMLLTS